MSITQKTHYNPCFWTALWNENYYSQISNNPDLKKRCRNQLIHSLNLKTDKVLHCKVENVHYENKLGISEIKPEDAKEYCRSVFPDSYDELCTYYDKNPNNLVLDFENVFSGVEDSPAYRSLMDVAINHGISTKEDKANLAAFIVMHNMRNHVIINSMVEMFEKIGRYRFEHFIWMKHAWSNPDILYSLVMPLLEGQWMLYKLRSHTFPLGDSPIMCKHGSIMVALSPRILLEIDLKISSDIEKWIEKDGIPKFKFKEFRKRTICYSFREIIFCNSKVLEKWKKTKEYKSRVSLLANMNSLNKLIKIERNREIWKINAFAGI